MILSITQTVLGIVITLAACYVAGWMLFKAPAQMRQSFPAGGGTMMYVDTVPENNELFTAARYGSYALPVIGLFLVITGAVRAARGNTKSASFAVMAMVAGLVVAALGFIITNYGYPSTFHAVRGGPDGALLTVFANYGRSHVVIEYVSASLVLLGLAVAGVAVAQLVKSRKLSIHEVNLYGTEISIL